MTEYPLTANGNVAPSVTLAGDNTGIDFPVGIASDSVGSLRIGNGLGGFQGIGGSITSYVKRASGNSSPIATIAGANTGLTDAVASGGLSSVAVDAAGNIYAASTWDLTVYARGATGDVAPIATIAGSKTELFNLNGIAADGAGKIYAANYDGPAASITVYAPGANGNVAPVAKVSGPRTGLEPQALAVDANGTVYVANAVAALASVTVYPPGAIDDVSPQRLISGSNTGLVVKSLLAVFALGLAAASATYAPPAWAQTGQQELFRRNCDAAAESKKLTGAAQKELHRGLPQREGSGGISSFAAAEIPIVRPEGRRPKAVGR